MTLAYWCVFIAVCFPYIFTILAKSGGNLDNSDPRSYLATVIGWRKRAHHVQLNCFEVHPAFGLSVIIAELCHAPQDTIDKLAIAFIVSRIIYAALYLSNKAALRSLVWALGMVCIISLFCISA